MHLKIIYLHAKLFFNLASTFFINYITMSVCAASKWRIVLSISHGHNGLSLINFRFPISDFHPVHIIIPLWPELIQLVQLLSATFDQSHSQYTIINVTKGEQY